MVQLEVVQDVGDNSEVMLTKEFAPAQYCADRALKSIGFRWISVTLGFHRQRVIIFSFTALIYIEIEKKKSIKTTSKLVVCTSPRRACCWPAS